MSKFEVIVGNIGTVIATDVRTEAESVFRDYVDQSRSSYGRTSGEHVTMLSDGEIIDEV